jgi:cellulose 1,4-beta-cellobiosidase
MTQFFVQNNKKITIPPPTFEGLPASADITPEFCTKVFDVFGDKNRFDEVGGWPQLNAALKIPMVLVMSIWDDVSVSILSQRRTMG